MHQILTALSFNGKLVFCIRFITMVLLSVREKLL